MRAAYYQPLAEADQIIDGKIISAARINAAASFIERSGLDVTDDWRFMDIECAMFAAASHMPHGSEFMELANDVALLRRIRAKAHVSQEEAA